MNFGPCSTVNGPLFVPRIGCIALRCQYREVLLFAGMSSTAVNRSRERSAYLLIERFRENVETHPEVYETCLAAGTRKYLWDEREKEETRSGGERGGGKEEKYGIS